MQRLFILSLSLLALVLATPASAELTGADLTSNLNKLSDVELAELAVDLAKQVAAIEADGVLGAVNTVADVEPDEVEKWFMLIDKVGLGILKLAKQLGLEANELLKTPVGIMGMGLIVLHVAGDQLWGIVAGLLWLIVTIPIWTLYFYKAVIPVVSYQEITRSRRQPLIPWRIPSDSDVKVIKAIRRQASFDFDLDASGPTIGASAALGVILIAAMAFFA
jgi:hypothetical protein